MPYDAQFIQSGTSAIFDLKGPADALLSWAGDTLPPFPNHPNSRTVKNGTSLCFTGPDHWLLLADLTQETGLDAALRPAQAPPEISIVRMSDTLAWFRITGPQASEVMSIGCPLDLHDSQFAPDSATFTEFFGLRALVLRCRGGFDVAVDQSHAAMTADYLNRALS